MYSGVLVVDKPAGRTSHDVVQRIRRLTGVKVGHTGTLDPAATGVLPLTLGRATRLTRFFQATDKEYIAEVCFGITTDSYDAEGTTIRQAPVPPLQDVGLEKLLQRLTGEIDQVPPMFSAIKIAGQRLYKAARRQEVIDRPSRQVKIFRLELLEQRESVIKLHVHCSSGTYVRTIAYDLGEMIGCGAHLQSLRRIRSGEFTLDQAVGWDQVEERWEENLILMETLLPEYPRMDLNKLESLRIRNGNSIPYTGAAAGESVFRLFDDDSMIALGKILDQQVVPFIVLRPGA